MQNVLMKSFYKLVYTLSLLFVLVLGNSTYAQFSITNSTSSLSNNFNSYNPSSLANLTSTVNSTNVLSNMSGTGWTASSSGTANYGGQTPSTTSGGYWGFGSAGSFALGGLRSGTPGNITYTVSFVNNSGTTITSITLAWDYKQHSYSNTSGWNVTGTGQLSSNTTLNGKDFAGSASGSGITTTAVSSFTLSGLSIANGQSFGLTWVTTDVTGSDNCVSIDNFSIATSATVAPPVASNGSTTGTVGTTFTTFNLSTLATNSPTSYTQTGGTLPPGLSLNTTSGAITGTPTAAGSYSINFTASNSGGTSAAATLGFTIAKGNQTITFNTLTAVVYGTSPGTLTATSSSGLAVSFSSANTTVATVSGSTISYLAVGSSNITATQAGDANWNAATAVVRTQTVTAKALTIAGLTGVSKAYDATASATATGTATLSGVVSGDAGNVTLAGTPTFTFNTAAVGTSKPITTAGYTISGSAAANYTLTQPTLTANITPLTLTLTGATANNKVYDGTTAATINAGTLSGVLPADAANVNATTGTFATANVGTNIAVTVLLTGTAAGNYTLTQPGLTADITKANQTITFGALADKYTNSSAFSLTATSSSGLTVTYTSSNTSVATVSGSIVTIVGAGSTVITASQIGNGNYFAAADVQQTQLVIDAPVTLATYMFTGSPGTLAASGVAPNVTFSNVVPNTINQNSNASNAFSGAPSSGTWGSAFSATRYIEFTITPASGFVLNAYSFDMDVFRSGAGATNYAVRSSVDGYAANLASGSVTTTQTGISTLILPSGFSNLSSLTFRIYGWGGTSTGDFRIDNISVDGNLITTCTTPTTLAFQTQPVTSNQDVLIPIAVKATCSNGVTATGLNTGSVTLTTTGCGLQQNGSSVSSVTANFVNGIATFTNITFARSVQSNINFTTTNTLGLTNITSSNFTVNAPSGTAPTTTTLVSETFEIATQWPYAVGTPSYSGSGGGGIDNVAIKTFSSNKSLCKSYTTNNSASERKSTTTVTFNNQIIPSNYEYATFSFQLASLGSGSGAGVDGGDDFKMEVSLDGGTTWSTLLTYFGNNDYLFNYSSSPTTSLAYNANAQYNDPSTKSKFSVQLPNGTSQFMFRYTATNNRSNENWAIDNILLTGTDIPVGNPNPLPIATGGTISTCPNTNNTLTVLTENTVGAVTYSWSPTTNMVPSSGNVSNPVVNPATATVYTVVVTDADGCTASTTQSIIVPTGTAGVWTGNENNDWFQCLNWADGIVPTTTTNVLIPNAVANTAIIDPLSTFAQAFAGIAYANNITINTGASLTGVYGSYLNINGNWDNNGSFNPGDGTVSFTGSGSATINGSSAQLFNNLIIDKPVQLLQDAYSGGLGSLTVNSGFDLNQHVFTVQNSINSAIVRNAGGYVYTETQNGASRLLWQLDDYAYGVNYIFPIGTSSANYTPVTFKLNSGFIGLAGVSTYHSAGATTLPTGSSSVLNVANPVNAVQRYWHLESDQPANTYNADVTFTYTATDDPSIGPGANVKFQRYNKPTDTWDLPLTTQSYNYATTRSVLVQGITKFSWWGGGNENTNPLPIQLLIFTAKPDNKQVELKWATATELNNDYFTVERSIDGISFTPIAVVQGAGNSNIQLNYQTTDIEPLNGVSYYRLKQTDYNGNYTYSQIVPVVFNESTPQLINSFINANGHLELWLGYNADASATTSVFDAHGRVLATFSSNITNGINKLSYAVNLPAAIYFTRIQVGNYIFSSPIVVP